MALKKTNGTAVAKRKEAPVPAAAAANPYLDAANSIGSSGMPFLKFNGKSGVYSAGSDDKEIEIGHQLAVNMEEFKVGWICWKDDEVVDEVMATVSLGERKAAKASLADHGPYDDKQDGWKEQASVAFRSIEDGEEYLYKTSSASGVNVMRELLKEFGKLMAEHDDEVMVIELGQESFEARVEGKKKKQKNYKPVFTVVGWMSIDELQELAGSADGENPDDYDKEDEDEDLVEDEDDGNEETTSEDEDEDNSSDGDDEDEDKEPAKKAGSKSITARGRKGKRF